MPRPAITRAFGADPSVALQLARRMTTALSLLAGAAALLAVLTMSAEARADGPKQGASTAQVLAEESKPMPKAAPQAPHAANATHAHAKRHSNANAKSKAQPHPKAKTKAKPHAKPAKAHVKPAKPTASARA